MQRKQNAQLEARLDNNAYDESQLVELKIPIHLPYQTTWSSYQRHDGEIEVNGILYKYVKRKVANDTLFLMCIANTKKMQLETAKDDFFKITIDLVQKNSSKKSNNSKSTFKNLQSEYDQYLFDLNMNSEVLDRRNLWLPAQSQNLLSSSHNSPEQPPDLLYA